MTAPTTWDAAVLEWARPRAASLGLDAARLQIVRVVNPSGWFMNQSFGLTDGHARLHGKLAPHDADTVDDMRRVFACGDALRPYHAPAFVAWMELGDWCGYLTAHVDGTEPERTLVPEIVAVVERLHVDERLAASLPTGITTTRDAFAELFLGRFTEDLTGLEPPPFVSAETFAWMHTEVERLRASTAIAAFDEPARAVVHGDLHLGNILVERSGAWWIVDWDEMHRGDAAIDLAILLRPWIAHGESVDAFVHAKDAAFRERFAVACRAVVLDEIIDTLANWATATEVPAVTESVRAKMQRIHERALVEYRGRYDSSAPR
jgi:hypothetical protein